MSRRCRACWDLCLILMTAYLFLLTMGSRSICSWNSRYINSCFKRGWNFLSCFSRRICSCLSLVESSFHICLGKLLTLIGLFIALYLVIPFETRIETYELTPDAFISTNKYVLALFLPCGKLACSMSQIYCDVICYHN